ncbi:MAG: branched-chain amino acid ABC transporter permease [Desulfobacteraceae bacterium]
MLEIRKTPILAAALAIVLFPFLAAQIPAIAHYTGIMVFAGIYCLITIGLSLLMGYAGQISLGHAAFYGIGAYTSGILTTKFGLNPWLCMAAGALLASVVAVAVGAPSLKLKGHYLAMATLAFGIIINIVFREEVEWTGGPDGMINIPRMQLFGWKINSTTDFYYLVWLVVAGAFVFTINILQSPAGRALRAIHTSEAAAGAMGINVSHYKIIVFVYSAALASLAGSLYAHYMNFINPSSFDLFFSIKLIIMIALGGMHSIWGAIVGTILIAFLSLEWLHFFEEFEILVYGAILLIVTIFLPNGLIGLPQVVRERFRR